MTKEQLLYWKDIGIGGFECYNIYYQEEENIGYYIDFCKEHTLHISGGSDSHGSFVPRPLGALMLTEDQLSLGEITEEFITI